MVEHCCNALAHASYFMQPKPISKSQQEHKSKPVDSFLEEHCFIGSRILSQTGIFSEFSLFIIIYHEEICEAAMGGGGQRQRSVLRVREPKKMGARSGRARSVVVKTH